MKSRFLVTTSIQSTWRFDMPLVFLGEWCKLYSQKSIWESIDSSVASYRWDNRKLLFDDYLYLDRLYHKILPVLADQLNKIHNTQHSTRYWELIIGPWLQIFTQILFERFHQIETVKKEFSISGTIISDSKLEEFVPIDMHQFSTYFVSDEWNYHIYSAIIKEDSSIVHSNLRLDFPLPNIIPVPEYKTKFTFKHLIYECSKLLPKRKDLVVIDLSISIFTALKIFINKGYVFARTPKLKLSHSDVNIKYRNWKLDLENKNNFELFLFNSIPLQIPILYVEGYKSMVSFCNKLSLPDKPKIILTSYVTYNEEFKFWAASKIEKGAKLAILQHGGGYGIGKWFSNEDHEINVSDYFLTWGWTNKALKNIFPVGMIKPNSFVKPHKNRQKHALLILGSHPRYSYKLYSETVSKQYINYISDQFIFINCLSLEIKNKLIVKVYQNQYGWDELLRFKDTFPDINIENCNASLKKLSKNSKIIISTYNSTTFLETLNANIPTIIFWDPVYWELRSTVIPFFDDLKKVGIFHETASSAACHLNNVWFDVDTWWFSSKTQEVIKNFIFVYCNSSTGRTGDFFNLLNK